jgi:hypothetical protein
MRTGVTVYLSPTGRKRLQAIVDDRNSPQKHVWPSPSLAERESSIRAKKSFKNCYPGVHRLRQADYLAFSFVRHFAAQIQLGNFLGLIRQRIPVLSIGVNRNRQSVFSFVFPFAGLCVDNFVQYRLSLFFLIAKYGVFQKTQGAIVQRWSGVLIFDVTEQRKLRAPSDLRIADVKRTPQNRPAKRGYA